jgi:ribosomal protein S18 acetylase RimI-like enzyme
MRGDMSLVSNLDESRFAEAYQLWLEAGWNGEYGIDEAAFRQSWRGSIVKKCIVLDDKIIAIGRANSDGVLYSMIHDIVVQREYRQKGHGRLIVDAIIRDLRNANIKVIQLMAATNQWPFYQKLGFEVRSSERPGMQYAR